MPQRKDWGTSVRIYRIWLRFLFWFTHLFYYIIRPIIKKKNSYCSFVYYYISQPFLTLKSLCFTWLINFFCIFSVAKPFHPEFKGCQSLLSELVTRLFFVCLWYLLLFVWLFLIIIVVIITVIFFCVLLISDEHPQIRYRRLNYTR